MLLAVLVVASGEETQLAGAGGSTWRKYMFRRHQDQPSVPVSPGHPGLTVAGRQQQQRGGWGRRGCCARCHWWCPEAPGWDRWPSAGPWRAWEPPGPARHCLLSLCPTPAPSAQSAEWWGGVGGRVGRAMAGAGGRRRRPGRRQAHAGLSVGPGDFLDQRSTRCQRVRAAPASPAACCPHEGTACRGRGAWRP